MTAHASHDPRRRPVRQRRQGGAGPRLWLSPALGSPCWSTAWTSVCRMGRWSSGCGRCTGCCADGDATSAGINGRRVRAGSADQGGDDAAGMQCHHRAGLARLVVQMEVLSVLRAGSSRECEVGVGGQLDLAADLQRPVRVRRIENEQCRVRIPAQVLGLLPRACLADLRLFPRYERRHA